MEIGERRLTPRGAERGDVLEAGLDPVTWNEVARSASKTSWSDAPSWASCQPTTEHGSVELDPEARASPTASNLGGNPNRSRSDSARPASGSAVAVRLVRVAKIPTVLLPSVCEIHPDRWS